MSDLPPEANTWIIWAAIYWAAAIVVAIVGLGVVFSRAKQFDRNYGIDE